MRLSKLTYRINTFLIFFFCCLLSFSQNDKQKELEQRRQQILNEIKQINALISDNNYKKKSQLSVIEDLNYKINSLNNLIKVTNQQANLLTREINFNQNQITELREDLKGLKDNYAAMIVKSYKSKNEQSRVMFLLSSSDFSQALKRLNYIKQYSNYQKEQGEIIKAKTIELQELNTKLLKQKDDKQKLIAENKVTQRELEAQRKQHQAVMSSINKNLNIYTAQIKAKQREADRIDKEIEKIIKEAIASSNKKAGKSNTTFELTAEAKALAASFVANKGSLPWPVEKGIVTLRYGKQQHPVVKTATIQSNGVRIATEKNAQVRAVFDGEVLAVSTIRHGNPTVLIQHGNYITAYKNLAKVYVKKGDKVKTKQSIGEVFTNSSNGETILNFSVFKESTTQNPAEWIYKM
ncbi:peptidoglycan DD-metalloendopeptidase family protein [Yeosuana sp. MJ-SS3]|jgi:septal ring factor EnvC (AmiA/AmiB activator)|uniref:Peptidoglycan DD-metalloendopeptidase family protein n=1 Tax=Gilvirhabdus luticola TaxID=3079858 RepID=A0ABU3U2H7_9FLAO|nr:peptidoglycan DD-metalloendopeptidase family protein [Yeosuana sp. MJ-SS3]MDU8884611.1 peptidoglycan DD-metalloendopeptidase family protein [Yeosuana sp. MJ-SS3]